MMKTIFFTLTVLLSLVPFAQVDPLGDCPNEGWAVEPYQDPDSCCFLFEVLPKTPDFMWEYWIVVANDSTFTNADVLSGKFKVCYEESGLHNVVITYYDAISFEPMCQTNTTVIVDEPCVPPVPPSPAPLCNFHLCWSANGDEANMQALESIIGMKIVDGEGVLHTIPFYGTPLDISGQFTEILDEFIYTLTEDFKLDPDNAGADSTNCLKGSTPQPGFALTANFISVSFYGLDDGGAPIEVFFEKDCEPICIFHLCWSANGDAPSMQALESIIGMNVVDADSAVHNFPFYASPLDISGQFLEILDEFIFALTEDLKLDSTDAGTDSTNCLKGSTPQPGFVVTADFISVSFYGLDKDGNPIEVFFEKDCESTRVSLSRPTGQTQTSSTTHNFSNLRVTTVPNPARDQVVVTLTDKTGKATLTQPYLILLDLSGRTLYTTPVQLGIPHQIDLSTLSSGLYLIKTYDGDIVLSAEKLVIE